MKTHKIWTVTVKDWSQKFLHNPSWATVMMALSDEPELQAAVNAGKLAVHFSPEEVLVNTPIEGTVEPLVKNDRVWAW
jgi:hypothetical protein